MYNLLPLHFFPITFLIILLYCFYTGQSQFELQKTNKMPVTEVAIIPLAHSLTTSNPTLSAPLIQKWLTSRHAMHAATGNEFYYFQQIEDPSILYIIGKWDSPTAHSEFIAGTENQRLLDLLKDDIVIHGEGEKGMRMWHLDAECFTPSSKLLLGAKAISFNRHFVPKEKKAEFEKKFAEVKGLLEEYTKPYPVVGGWRIEKETVDGVERDEWDLFSGFESVEHHMNFAKTEAFEKYREIAGYVEGFEMKHLRAIDGL